MGSPSLDWVQVEITTDCNAACIYCPHTLMRNRWMSRHMSMEVFHRLSPSLTYIDLVYLQGWGEPLLNDNIFEMVRICKNRGTRVGFTTNGMLLTEDTIRILIGLQLDILGISLAGTTVTTHDTIRKGTDFKTIIANLELLSEIKDEKQTQFPAVHIAYIILKSNFHELKEIVRLAKRVRAQQIVAANLTLIVDPKLSAEPIFTDTGRTDLYRITLEEIRNQAAQESIVFGSPSPSLDDKSLRCRENVCRACVINVDGEIVPCVFTDPVLCENGEPGDHKSPRYIFKNQSVPFRGISFGNICDESLPRIWRKREYARFRDLFDPEILKSPAHILSEMPQSCVTCYKRLGA